MLSIAQLFIAWLVLLSVFVGYKISTTSPDDIDQKYSETTSFSNWTTQDTQFPLVINQWPIDARIRVMNIPEKYQRYMLLPKGDYTIEVSAPGHKTQTKVVKLDQHFVIQKIALRPEKG